MKKFFLYSMVAVFLLLGAGIGFIGYDIDRTEIAVTALHTQLQKGVPLVQLVPPEHGRLFIWAYHPPGKQGCLTYQERLSNNQAIWRTRDKAGWQDVSEPVLRKNVFKKIIATLQSLPNCNQLEIVLHQGYGFMSGSIGLVVGADGLATQLSSPRFLD